MEAVVIRVVSTHDVERARRSALALAADLGFGPITAECVALATTELASNLVRYTVGGTVTVDAIRGPQPGILLESQDEGPGVPDLLAARRDGFTTGDGLGCGLGAVERLMDQSEFRSSTAGTTIVARKWTDPR